MLNSVSSFSVTNPLKSRNFQELTGTFNVPAISFASATTSSVTTTLTNYDAAMTYVVSSSAGTASRTNQTITVTGLSANQSTTVTATATGSKGLAFTTTSSAFLSLPATPTLSQTGQTETSVTVTITNYDAGLTYTVGSSAGSATRSGNLITVTGLTGGQTVTVTATAANSSGNSTQGSISATSAIPSDYESIATVTIGSGGASSIEFTSIPTTYQHLILRGIGRISTGGNTSPIRLTLNQVSGTSYTQHVFYNDSTTLTSFGFPNTNWIEAAWATANSSTANSFGAQIISILDYSSTSKFKTVLVSGGLENGSVGAVQLHSGLFRSTNQITSIQLNFAGSSAAQYTTFALYGIKAP